MGFGFVLTLAIWLFVVWLVFWFAVFFFILIWFDLNHSNRFCWLQIFVRKQRLHWYDEILQNKNILTNALCSMYGHEHIVYRRWWPAYLRLINSQLGWHSNFIFKIQIGMTYKFKIFAILLLNFMKYCKIQYILFVVFHIRVKIKIIIMRAIKFHFSLSWKHALIYTHTHTHSANWKQQYTCNKNEIFIIW